MSSNTHYWIQDLEKYAKELRALKYTPRDQGPELAHRHGRWVYGVHYPAGQLIDEDVHCILPDAAMPPQGRALFKAPDLPVLPSPPSQPHNLTPLTPASPAGGFWRVLTAPPKPTTTDEKTSHALALSDECALLRDSVVASLKAAQADHQRELDALLQRCVSSPDHGQSLDLVLRYADRSHALVSPLRRPITCRYDGVIRTLLVQVEVPDFVSLKIVKRGKRHNYIDVAKREKAGLVEKLLYALTIRALYLASQSDISDCVDLVVVNAVQEWRDKVTGALKKGVVASVQSEKRLALGLELAHVDAKSCFLALKGIRTPNIEDIASIRPIFDFSKEDDRIVEAKLFSEIPQQQNLATMEWEDFEHLVRQLFEWEFGKDGAEVKITRASRDRGVDAIMFDPDPIRGGKYVIQAKRYTSTVGVEAVRDLYGTVINEGANRGILVTTSSYGPDSYEFAKGKPISLVDGHHLLKMFEKHGQKYSIHS